MPDVGSGVYEIRISTPPAKDQYRVVFYVAKSEEAACTLRAFQKQTQKTAKKDINKGKRVHAELIEELRS